tara:strand:+ start:1936 stop:3468 length:1533 start_codon:yes stop_codon:yes gene_type:complete
MAEDLDIDEWDMYDALAKMNEGDSLTVVRSKKTELPKDALRWRDVVGEFSLYNEYPAVMSYYVTLGQMLKDMVRIPIGRLSLDPRIHYCWIQTARSGKTTMFDFLSPVWKRTFSLINNHPTTTDEPTLPLTGVKEFTLNNPDSFTDQALLGTMKINTPNPDYSRADARNDEDYDIPELIDMTIYGSLYGSGIIAFDEFEHSGIFKESQHKQETVMLFQKFMNRLDSDSHLIRKRLTEWGRDLVVDSQRSLWATTLPPEGLEKVILTKGVFQRMWLYVREVPESLKQKMEEDYIDMIGEIIEGEDGAAPYQEEFAEMLYNTYRWVEQRLEEENGDPRKVVMFSDDAQKRLKTVWKGMRKYMNNFDDNIYEALNTFLMNMINNICIAAGLCAVAERSKVITAKHINQGRQLTDESFDSITGWFTDKLKKRPKRLADKNNEKMYIAAYNSTSPKVKVNGIAGWVDKRLMIETFRKQEQCGRNKFYRHWQSVSHLFEEVRTSKTFVKLKVKEDE